MGLVRARAGVVFIASGFQLVTGLEHEETGGPGDQVCHHHDRKPYDLGPLCLASKPIAKAVNKVEKGIEVADNL